MGDMAEVFAALKDERKKNKKKRLEEANTDGWISHSPYHFTKMMPDGYISWWPSTVKAQYRNKMYYGYKEVKKLFDSLGLQMTK